MSQASHINSNLMNSNNNTHHHLPAGGDTGQNENENHLIGNILAEEDEYNSGSDIEESKLLSATTGAGAATYISNANNGSGSGSGSGTSNVGAGGVTGGFGQISGKLTPFGGPAGFGLPGSSHYGGAFNNSGIPDRVGSSSGADHNNKYFDSPAGKKQLVTQATQNQAGLPGAAFSNIFPAVAESFASNGGLDPLIRRPSGIMDAGFPSGSGQNPVGASDAKMNIHSLLSPVVVGGPQTCGVLGSNNFNGGENQASEISAGQPPFADINPSDANQQNIYTTKEYYDYYHSLKVRDPRLPPPQYTPSQAELNEQAMKNASASNITDEIEKKLNQLNLNTGSMEAQNPLAQNPLAQNLGHNAPASILQSFGTKPQIFGQNPGQVVVDQAQLPFPLQQYPINPLLFGQGAQVPLQIQPPSQPATYQSAHALLQQLSQQHMSNNPVSTQSSQPQQPQVAQSNQQSNTNTSSSNGANPSQGRPKKGKKGFAQEPPPMPKPPGQQLKTAATNNTNSISQQQVIGGTIQGLNNQQQQQNRVGIQQVAQPGFANAYGQFANNNQLTGQMMGTVSQQNGLDNKSSQISYPGWIGQNLQQNMNPFAMMNNNQGAQTSQIAGSQSIQGNLQALAGSLAGNQLTSGGFPQGLNPQGQVGLAQQSLFGQNGLYGANQQNMLHQNPTSGLTSVPGLFGQGDQQQQAALLMQNYASMGMQNPYAAAMLMNRMMNAQMYPSGNNVSPLANQYPLAASQAQGFGGAAFGHVPPVQQNLNNVNQYLGNQASQFGSNSSINTSQNEASGNQYQRKGGYNNQMNQSQNLGQPHAQIRGGSNAQGLGRGGGRGGIQSGYTPAAGRNQGPHAQSGRGNQGLGGFGAPINRGGHDYSMSSQNPLYPQAPLGRTDSTNQQQYMDQMDQSMPGGMIQQAKSEFLEDLRNKIQNGKKIEIKEIKDHVVECSMDQYGSRFIQQKYDVTTEEEKELIFSEILPEANALMNDVFGNYVVQKLFEYGTDFQRATLAEQLLGNVLKLTKSMYGCRVVQKALEVISLEQKKLLVQELKEAVIDCIYDQNGNHVIQKCIEKMPSEQVDFILHTILDKPNHVKDLCLHTYGCRVIQRILEKCHDSQTDPIIEAIILDIQALTKDQFGNYVIQHILEQGRSQEDKNRIVKSIKGRVIELSNHKFASNVVEKCLQHGSEKDKKEIIDEFLESNYELAEEITNLGGPQLNGALYTMMKDRYGNYVIQKCIEVSKGKQREILIKKITACANVLRKQQNYSRHVYNFIEKFSPIDGSDGMNPNLDFNGSQQENQYQHHQGSGGGRGRGGSSHHGHSTGSYGGNNYVDTMNNAGDGYNPYSQNYSSSQGRGGGPHYVQKKQQHHPGGGYIPQKKK